MSIEQITYFERELHHATAIAYQRAQSVGKKVIDPLIWLDAIFTHVSSWKKISKALGSDAGWNWKTCAKALRTAMVKRYPGLAHLPDETAPMASRLEHLDNSNLYTIAMAVRHVAGSSNRDYPVVDVVDLIIPLLMLYEAYDDENVLDPLGLNSLAVMTKDKRIHTEKILDFKPEEEIPVKTIFTPGTLEHLLLTDGEENEDEGEDVDVDVDGEDEGEGEGEDEEDDGGEEPTSKNPPLSGMNPQMQRLSKAGVICFDILKEEKILTPYEFVEMVAERNRDIQPDRHREVSMEHPCTDQDYATLYVVSMCVQRSYYKSLGIGGKPRFSNVKPMDYSGITVPEEFVGRLKPLVDEAQDFAHREPGPDEWRFIAYVLQECYKIFWKIMDTDPAPEFHPEEYEIDRRTPEEIKEDEEDGFFDDDDDDDDDDDYYDDDEEEESSRAGQSKRVKKGTPIPEEVIALTTNLTAEAKSGHLDPLIGREKELEQLFFIMSCRRKNKPLILGEPGIGKTALVEGLAQRIVEGKTPQFLHDYRILSLHTESMASRYKGAFAEKLARVVRFLQEASRVILFVDNAHTLIDSPEDSSKEQMNAIENMVSQSGLPIILSSTFDAWRTAFRKNAVVNQRLSTVELSPLTQEESVKVLKGLVPQYEAFHKVRYAEGVVEDIVKLSDRFIVDRVLPEKAVDVLDQLAARARLNYEKAHPEEDLSTLTLEVDASLIPEVIATIVRLPADQVKADDKSSVRDLEKIIKEKVYGQDEAVGAIVSAIKVARSGLNQMERPMGSFLFTGPTGVGKTEAARQLAKALNVPLLRFDMSEYAESHTISRFIGSPAGYVGYGDGGLLTERVNKHPYSVVLLDEIEKAHPVLFNLLLQVMDHGKLTDASGREADFRNVVLIMTSNVGAREGERQSIGFGGASNMGDITQALKQVFTPEFRNRFDAIIRFLPLNTESLYRVVDKFLGELSARLTERGVSATFSDRLKAYLVKHGYVPAMGARPMRRLIDDKLRRPLADELLFGALVNGGCVTVDLNDADEVIFLYDKVEENAGNA